MHRRLHHLTFSLLCLSFVLCGAAAGKAQANRPPVTAWPRLVVQLGHPGGVTAVAVAKNGRFILTGGADNTACLWDNASGRELVRFSGHQYPVNSVAFLRNDREVMTASADYTVRFYDALTGKTLRHIVETAGNRAVLSPDERYLLTFGASVTLWEVATGQRLREFIGHSTSVEFAAFSADNQRLLTGSSDRSVRLWEVETGKLLQTFAVETLKPRQDYALVFPPVAFSHTGQWMVMGGNTAVLRDARTGEKLQQLATDLGDVQAVAFSPSDDKFLLTVQSAEPLFQRPDFSLTAQPVAPRFAYKVRLWETATGKEVRAFELGQKGEVGAVSIAFSPDGNQIFAAHSETVVRWDVRTGETLREFTGYGSIVHAIAFSPNGHDLLTGGGDGHASVWDLAEGRMLSPFKHPDLKPFGGVLSAVFAPDGRAVMTGGRDGSAQRWDLETGSKADSFRGGGPIRTIAISPDAGRFVFIGGYVYGILYDTTNQREPWYLYKTIINYEPPAHSSAFSPDGRYLLLGQADLKEKQVCLWDVKTEQKIRCYDDTPTSLRDEAERRKYQFANAANPVAAFSRDGSLVVTSKGSVIRGSEQTGVHVFQTATGQLVNQFVSPSPVNAIAFLADDRFILTGNEDGVVYLWNRKTGKLEREFKGHSSRIESLALAPNERWLATGSDDGTTRLWDFASGRERCRLITFRDGTWAVIDAEGRFDTNSIEAIQGLHWLMPDDLLTPLPLEIYLRDYYQPQLLDSLLRGEPLKPVRDISRLNRAQPAVKIISVEPQTDHPELVTVTVEVAAKAGGVFDLRLFRDGQLVAQRPQPDAWAETNRSDLKDTEKLQQWRDKSRVETSGQQHFTFANIRLPQVEKGSFVEFSAYAFNDDRVKSATHRWNYQVKQPLPAVKKRAFLVTIGVNESQSYAGSLPIAGHDAKQIKDKLSEQLTKMMEYEVVSIPITAQQATKGKIQTELRLLAGKAGPEDLVIISISSHGKRDQAGNFYFLPYDIGTGPITSLKEAFLKRCISSEELTGWLREIDAGVMALIIDACYSAAAIKTAEFKPGPMGDAGLGQLAYDKGMQILAASQSDQEALESKEIALSFLMQALLPQGLIERQADQFPLDGKITLREWLQYGVKRVPELHAQEFQPKLWQFASTTRRGKKEAASQKKNVLQRPALFDFGRPPHLTKPREVILVRPPPSPPQK